MIALHRFAVISLAIAALAAGACKRSAPPSMKATRSFDDRVTVGVGGERVRLRLAVLPFEQQRGLMNVASMPDDEGMLFIYDQPQRMSFWMKNTLLPLDIGFFDGEGVLREVYPMYPHIENPVASRSQALQFALEMNQGWFARRGLKPGARIDLEAIRTGLRERGLDDKSIAGKNG